MAPEVGRFLSKDINIPVYGIRAGFDVDGQLLIVNDMLGTFQTYTPKFVKKYANLGGANTEGNQGLCN